MMNLTERGKKKDIIVSWEKRRGIQNEGVTYRK